MTGQNLGGGLGALGKSARIYQAQSLDLSAGVTSVVPFSNVRFDKDGMFSATATNLTGTVAKTNGSASLTGTGTLFTTELAVGDYIQVGTEIRQVLTIPSATSLTVLSIFNATASGVTATKPPTKLRANTPGIYIATFRAYISTSVSTGDRDTRLRLNGTTLIEFERITPARTDAQVQAVSPWEFAVGDYVEALVTSSVSGSIPVNAAFSPELSLIGVS